MRSALGRQKKCLLVDRLPLRRVGIVSLLRSAVGAGAVEIEPSVEDILSSKLARTDAPDLVVFSVGQTAVASAETSSLVARLVAHFPNAPLVVVSERGTRDDVLAAFKAGASGYLPMTLEAEVAVLVLRLVLAGGSFFPPVALTEGPNTAAANGGGHVASRCPRLTPRQTEVLKLLSEGKSNKIIARELGMREATVKVRVRQILRQLGVTNRTQAAVVRNAALLAEEEDDEAGKHGDGGNGHDTEGELLGRGISLLGAVQLMPALAAVLVGIAGNS
jgi:DNA-binding NarL/FixJ family response regulator